MSKPIRGGLRHLAGMIATVLALALIASVPWAATAFDALAVLVWGLLLAVIGRVLLFNHE